MDMQGKRNNPIYQAEAILSRRDHSVFELQTKLRRRKFTDRQITEAISSLQARRLLNDDKFAQAFIESTLRQKAVGPRWLHSKLRQKGVARPAIEQALAAAFPPGAEEELARQAALAWRRTHSSARQPGNHQRLARFLASRGFSQGAISAIVVS